jgi:hypothetical protein
MQLVSTLFSISIGVAFKAISTAIYHSISDFAQCITASLLRAFEALGFAEAGR